MHTNLLPRLRHHMFTKHHPGHSTVCPCGTSPMTVENLLQNCPTHRNLRAKTWDRYHGCRRPSSDDSLHSPTVIPPSALDKPSIMKRYHRRRTTRWGVTAHFPTMVTLHDTRIVECRWRNDGWTVKTVVTWRSSASCWHTNEGETVWTLTGPLAHCGISRGLQRCCLRKRRWGRRFGEILGEQYVLSGVFVSFIILHGLKTSKWRLHLKN